MILDRDNMSKSEKIKDTKSRKKIGQEIRHLCDRADTAERQKWITQEQKSYDFFTNAQLTEDERDALKEAGMPDFVINRITPAIETMAYFAVSNSPRWKAVGVDGTDSQLAAIHEGVIEYAWNLSDGNSILYSAVVDALTKSKGYIHIVIDPSSDRGLGDVKFEYVDPFSVYTANMSSDYLERDAMYQIIKKYIPKETLKLLLPEYASIIDKASGYGSGDDYSEREYNEESTIQIHDITSQTATTGEDDTIIDYYEMYTPEMKKFYNVYIKNEPSESEISKSLERVKSMVKMRAEELAVEYKERDKELREMVASGDIIADRYDIEMRKLKDAMEAELQTYEKSLHAKIYTEGTSVEQLVLSEEEYEKIKSELKDSDRIIDAKEFTERRIVKRVSAGDMFLYEEELPTKYSPLVPIVYTHTGTPYPMSAVTPLVGKQREINKAHQIMIHNANLASNLRWMYAEGEVDEELWEKYSSSPGALLSYRPGFSQGGPREIMPQNINNAFFTIEQEAKSDIEYISGIHPQSMGISRSSDETYRGFLAKDEYGTRRIRAWVKNRLEPALRHLGYVFQDFAKYTYDSYRVLRITQADKESVVSKELEINIPIYDNNGEAIGRYNDYESSRYDIVYVSGSTLPINRWALLDEYKSWFELGIVDDIVMINMSDIPDKQSLIKRKSTIAELSAQKQNLEDNIKQQEGIIQTLKRQIVQMEIKVDAMNASMEIDKKKNETKSAEALAVSMIKNEMKGAMNKNNGK